MTQEPIWPPWAAGFEALSWPEQRRCLRELDNAASGIGGRTSAEAERKRRALYHRTAELQAIHDAQVRAWLNS